MSWHLFLSICSSYLLLFSILSSVLSIELLLNGLSVAIIRVYAKFITNLGGYWAPVILPKLVMKWEVRMKSVYKGRKAGGPNQFSYPNWCSGDFFSLWFLFALPPLLLMLFIKLKPSQNKILQIFWTDTQFQETVSTQFHSIMDTVQLEINTV